MRATTNGISAFAGDFAFHLASASTSLRRTFSPSQLRSTDSSTIRMLTGNREIFPIPCSSRAGKKKKNPSRPLPASNFLSVLNSSFSMSHTKSRRPRRHYSSKVNLASVVAVVRSFQFSQRRFDLLKIWHLPRVVVTLCVLDYAVLIHDECGSFRHATHP